MKMGLTEKQYKHILSKLSEQSEAAPVKAEPEAGTSSTQSGGAGYPQVGKWESGLTRGPANQIGVTKWADVVGSKLTRSKANQLKEQVIGSYYPDKMSGVPDNINPHDVSSITALLLGLIPHPITQLASTGVMVLDAKKYQEEGDQKTANLMYIFAAMGGIGVVMKFPFVKEIGTKGMSLIGEKLSKGIKLLPKENIIVKKIIENKDIIAQQLKNLSQTKVVKKVNKISNSTPGNLAKTGALYGGVMYGYNKLYDKYEQDKQVKYEDSILNNNFKGRK